MSDPASPEAPASASAPDTSTRALLRERDFLFFWAARFVSTLGVQIQSVALGWQVYAIARLTKSVGESAFLVSMIGLAQFLPLFLLTLIAGETADRRTRKLIVATTLALDAVSAAVLLTLALMGSHQLWPIFAISVLFGASRAFLSPASSAMGPMLVPRSLLPRAIAWNSLAWQSASIAGPALGGLLLIHSPAAAFGTSFGLYLTAALLALAIRKSTKPETQPGSRVELIKEGLAYVWNNKIVFGSISLDLFAVILGGATALLPVFAKDVLHIGPGGFGLLRAAPAIGATVVGVYLASTPIRRHAGRIMFAGVAVFGLATAVFGLSKLVWLSVVALAVLGGADMLSVYVRQTLVQIVTPDAMRGRVAAVSGVFISASNELGEVESGAAAWLLGPVGAAVFGGVGAMAVTALWAFLFPDLRKADRLE
ncbi:MULTISPECIES: MFS transporter [unclassified Caulobacter]|uniref:MFS transporter n=1 Tax=unclassified Caulobacter TaxID=2648921 RepID=UPI0006F42552|nr:MULTISPECIES: MFS transporter [unclassified Caulobacter]KQV55317.1 MFS transporter [Caulobacter sp. Root342]KQV63494.1 MFS transporter [Caulobacter sp. Root343]